jgi:hypothetical protein
VLAISWPSTADKKHGAAQSKFHLGPPASGTDRRVTHFSMTMAKSFENLESERAIALRWALRDIRGDRLKLSPVKEADLQSLIDLGFVEMKDDSPVVTEAGLAALE